MPKISDLVDIGTNVSAEDLYVVVDISASGTTPDKSIKHKNLFILPSGAVNDLSLRFAGDLDLGVYRADANNLSVVSAGVDTVRIIPSGVGVNTDQVDTSLHVKGPNTSNRGQLYIQSDATNADPRFILADSANTKYLSVRGDTSSNKVVHNAGSGVAYSWRIDGSEKFNVDPSGTFNVRGDGAQAFSVNSQAPSDSLIISPSGYSLFGTDTSRGTDAQVQVVEDVEIFNAGGTADDVPVLNLTRSRGSLGSPTEVNDGDSLGYVVFRGYDGASYVDAAWITVEADGTWTDGGDPTDNPTRLKISTTPDSEGTPTDHIVVKSTGRVGFSTPTPNALLHLYSSDASVLHVETTDVRSRLTMACPSGSVDLRTQDLGSYIIQTGGDGGTKGQNSVEGFRVTEDQVLCYNQPNPVSKVGAAYLSPSDLKQKIVVFSSGTSNVCTLPSGVELDASFSSPYTNMAFEFNIINSSAPAPVYVSGGVNNSLIGKTVFTNEARFVVRRAGGNTYETYCVAGD